ncbi:hypothetical protein [Alistipes sp.]|uniref:hypothetical protein n=1 Tax=Alistipes sp. TaxID=1872444 RepID=UPI003AF02227
MNAEQERIENFVERYFAGQTTEAEERDLRDRVRRGARVPAELGVLFEGLDALARETMPPVRVAGMRRMAFLRMVRPLLGVAAAAAVIAGVFLCTAWLRKPYCYIDGVAVYDREAAIETTRYLGQLAALDEPRLLLDELIETTKTE